ncbi:MAG: PilZ domain-containing protein, partial [Pseudomonadota bacterium]
IACPECGKIKQMDVSRFNDIVKEVKLKCTCTCQHVFQVILERRQHVRKSVDLSGELIFGDKRALVRVLDVSRIGLKIKTTQPLPLTIGSKSTIYFVLDDVGNSKVSKEVTIKSVNGTLVGLAFISHDHYDKFGNYILFQFD